MTNAVRAGSGLFVVLAVGCGEPPPYQPPPVGGAVVWQDGSEPRELEGGGLEFESSGAVAAKCGLHPDGTFLLDDPLPAGTYRVRVVAPTLGIHPPTLDPKFESFDTSGLTLTATSEPQKVTFKVRKRGGR